MWDELRIGKAKVVLIKALPYGIGAAIIIILLSKTIGMDTVVAIVTFLWSIRIAIAILLLIATVTLAVITVGGTGADQYEGWQAKRAKKKAAEAAEEKPAGTKPEKQKLGRDERRVAIEAAPPLEGFTALWYWMFSRDKPQGGDPTSRSQTGGK